jgi:hypothetical protein
MGIGRHRAARKFKLADLALDCNIIAHIHATGSALAAGKGHRDQNVEVFLH